MVRIKAEEPMQHLELALAHMVKLRISNAHENVISNPKFSKKYDMSDCVTDKSADSIPGNKLSNHEESKMTGSSRRQQMPIDEDGIIKLIENNHAMESKFMISLFDFGGQPIFDVSYSSPSAFAS